MMTHFSPVRLFLSTSLVLRCGVMTFVLCGLVFYVQSYHMSYPLDVMDCNLYVNQLVTYPLFYYCTSSLPPTFTQSNNSRLPLSSLKHKDKPTTSTSLTCSYHPCPVTPSSTPLSPLLSSTTALDPPYTHARIYTHLLKTAFPSASSLHSKCRPFLLGKTQLWDPWSLTAVRFDGVAGRHAGRRACCGGVGHHSVISALPTEQAISATATAAPDTAASTAVTTAQPHGASSTVSAAAPHTSYTPGGRSPHTASPRQVRKDGLEKPGLVGNKKRDQQAQLKQSQLLEILQSAYTLQETLRLYWMYRKSLSANLISHIFIQLGRLAKEQSFNYSKGMWYERNCSKRELLTDNRLTALLDDLEDEATAGRLSRATQLAWIPWAIARLKTWQGRGGKRAGTREEGADDGMAPLEFADRSVSGEGSVGVSERRGGEGWGDGGEGDEDGVVEGVWMRCDRLLKFVDCVMCQSFGEYRQKAREEKKMIRRGKHKQQKQQQQQQQHQLQHQQQQLQQQQQPQPQQQQPEQQQQNQQYHTQPQADPLTDFTLLPSTHLKTNPIPPPLSESQSLPQGTPHLPRPTQDPSSSSSSLPPQSNHGLEGDALRMIFRVRSNALSAMAWGFAKTGYASRGFWAVVGEAVLRNRNIFTEQEISNILSAYAMSGVRDRRVFDELGKCAARKIQLFTLQGVTNTAWSYAKLMIHHGHLFEKIAQQIILRKNYLSTLPLSLLYWSFARLGYSDMRVLRALEEATERAACGLSEGQLTQICWARLKLKMKGNNLLWETMLRRLLDISDNCTMKNLSTSMFCLGRLKLIDTVSLASLTDSIMQRSDSEFNAMDVAMLVHTFAASEAFSLKAMKKLVGLGSELLWAGLFRRSEAVWLVEAIADIGLYDDGIVRAGLHAITTMRSSDRLTLEQLASFLAAVSHLEGPHWMLLKQQHQTNGRRTTTAPSTDCQTASSESFDSYIRSEEAYVQGLSNLYEFAKDLIHGYTMKYTTKTKDKQTESKQSDDNSTEDECETRAGGRGESIVEGRMEKQGNIGSLVTIVSALVTSGELTAGKDDSLLESVHSCVMSQIEDMDAVDWIKLRELLRALKVFHAESWTRLFDNIPKQSGPGLNAVMHPTRVRQMLRDIEEAKKYVPNAVDLSDVVLMDEQTLFETPIYDLMPRVALSKDTFDYSKRDRQIQHRLLDTPLPTAPPSLAPLPSSEDDGRPCPPRVDPAPLVASSSFPQNPPVTVGR
eukprot:GHVQ01030662.1.p1 GENE.GHVQ01030662.1~~GHVQ01030662.1.p1  ORF type:complete len:1232 (+),score=268.42 GHVQ01030662.1:423-4118(+)